MREYIYSLEEISEVITDLPELFEQEPAIVTVTRHGKPVMTILSTNFYKEVIEPLDSVLETIEVLQDEELMASIRRGMKDIEEGRVRSWEEVKRELGWE